MRNVLLASIEMGYGHLRAAHALAEALGTGVRLIDAAPIADEEERRQWARARLLYESVSRASQLPIIGRPFDYLLDTVTSIPSLYPIRDLSRPSGAVRYLERAIGRGLGRGLAGLLRQSGDVLLTTFYAPAIAADRAGVDSPIFCVATDTDLNRVWAPAQAASSRIHYLVPGTRAARRLATYGVPPHNIHLTGFPLPPSLLGGPDLGRLRRDVRARLRRLDPRGTFHAATGDDVRHFLRLEDDAPDPTAARTRAPLVTFAVGGAGAQAQLARAFLPAFRPAIEEGKLRLCLVAGTRRTIAELFAAWTGEAGLGDRIGHGVEILCEPEIESYLARFHERLAETDVLWTKPSELTFFGALGLPLLLSRPVGRHESYNMRWARESGVALKQREPRLVAERLLDWLDDGTLAGAAWSGFIRMPKFGAYRIAEAVRAAAAA